MKKLIISLICLFACAGLQARITLHQSDFDQKSPIGAFSENTPESHQVQKLYLIETASGELLILAENRASGKYRARYFDTNLGRFISRDPLGYVDGYGLYNGYFAERFGTDPSGLICPSAKEVATNIASSGGNFGINISLSIGKVSIGAVISRKYTPISATCSKTETIMEPCRDTTFWPDWISTPDYWEEWQCSYDCSVNVKITLEVKVGIIMPNGWKKITSANVNGHAEWVTLESNEADLVKTDNRKCACEKKREDYKQIVDKNPVTVKAPKKPAAVKAPKKPAAVKAPKKPAAV